MAKEFIPIRLSHLLGHNGVGSIVRGTNGLYVIQDIRDWTDIRGHPAGKEIPYVERVKAALSIAQQLREPPIAQEVKKDQIDGVCVPAKRFPSWASCPSCGLLYRHPWMNQITHCTEEKCTKKSKLEQVVWVLADKKGFLDDVPWHYLAHSDNKKFQNENYCQTYDRLRFIKNQNIMSIKCIACNASYQFTGKELLHFKLGARMQPWTKNDLIPTSDKQGNEGATPDACVLAVNDSRVYLPHVETVLVIPPESRVRKGTVVDRLYRHSHVRSQIDNARTPLVRKSTIQKLSTEYRCSIQDIEAALDDLKRGYPLYGENLTPGQLRESEFDAFLEILQDQRDDEDLVTHNYSDLWHQLSQSEAYNNIQKNRISSIENLVRVDRLKGVKVFRGFSRIGEESIIPPDISGQSNWLPAIELYGEGIFITLNEQKLKSWESNDSIIARLQHLQPRFVQSGRITPNPLTPRFLLLHTLSHLLMRQIESEGGYPAAALNERIYCSTHPKAMAGILIHIAVPDIAGSLGGLAELSEPKRFLGILSKALEHANWCSLDPICSEHEGQGPNLLNRAACHACALVPEPACEHGNTLLDRGFLKSDDPEFELPSFFDGI